MFPQSSVTIFECVWIGGIPIWGGVACNVLEVVMLSHLAVRSTSPWWHSCALATSLVGALR